MMNKEDSPLDIPVTTYEVAAFSDNPSAGSPTGVVLEAGELSDDQMQRIAQQLNFSHTAFVSEACHEDYDVNIRFFTPTQEIKNCGHATIAAHYLRATQFSGGGDCIVRQRTLSGVQEVEIQRDSGLITVHFKQDEIHFCDVEPETVAELLSILKLPETALDRQYPVILASPGANRFLLAVNSTSTLHSLTPDIGKLKALCNRFNSIGCFVFKVDSDGLSIEASARMFAPNIGIDEDIINGNSSGCLGAYLLKLGANRSELSLSVHQGYAFNRPGTVLVNAKRVGNKIETTIGGRAVMVSKTQTEIP